MTMDPATGPLDLAVPAADRPAAPPPPAPAPERAKRPWYGRGRNAVTGSVTAGMLTGGIASPPGLAAVAADRPAAPVQPATSPGPRERRWRGVATRVRGVLGRATTVAIPVATAVPERQATRQPKTKMTWREQRWERRRKRRAAEEVLGWILVPVILLVGYWAIRSGLIALGTSPTALISGIKAAIASKS